MKAKAQWIEQRKIEMEWRKKRLEKEKPKFKDIIQKPIHYTPYTDDLTYRRIYIPDSALKHKEYPTCQCGRKYVPIEKGDKICFYCKFTQK